MSVNDEVWVDRYPMVIEMDEHQLNTVARLRIFLDVTQEVNCEPQGEVSKRHAFIAAVVVRLRYGHLPRPDKGVVRRYLERNTGYSRAPLKCLVRRARAGETLAKRPGLPH